MNKIKRIVAAWLLIFVILFNAVGCDLLPDIKVEGSSDINKNGEFRIDADLTLDMMVGDTVVFEVINTVDPDGEVIWTSTSSCATVENGKVTALTTGTTIIKATLGDKVDRVIVSIFDNTEDTPDDKPDDKPTDKPDDKPGDIIVGEGGEILLPNEDDPITSDPYVGVDKDEFYSTYSPAISYNDAYYRTQHGLMSGSIDKQDQEPTLASYQPTSGGKLVRNNAYLFSADGNTYYVVDGYGEIVMEIYRGGAYVVLEEVAAYVFAFGEPPANHSASKKTSPTASIWGIYLRVNNTKFSGDTSRYPYEPVLPRISGCGGDLTYYEMDIGTTGTDCDPSYTACDYNNGYSITRGAARIVYSCKDANGNNIIDLDERYLFYTYNHYNDFQEYLNYYGGWGEMFGNITGGGTLSSKSNYNPTPYVETVHAPLYEVRVTVVYYYVPKNECVA